ncbi:Uu.00g142570.m01.CDS01 [Anthostomella pinea]|uniref:Uu.00g142570.m01.CDS01 n=1 Tax=Anthostomella pinea TaxID=933095 RepID=A0AAI8VQL1_9PEZI|nr:Uu.00g142570.m01.CDS01 [Anthostomella pinea]
MPGGLSCALQPLTGKLYTYFRAKWIFLIFVLVFELGSLLCGLATSSNMLIGGRAVAGIGASGLSNGGLTIIAGAVPLDKSPLYTGIMLGIGQIGLISGPLVGGALTESATWRWCFYINLPIGGVAALMILLVKVPEITKKKAFSPGAVSRVLPKLDLVGFVHFVPAAIMFLLALPFGGDGTYAWGSATIIGLFVGAAATAVLFGLWEARMGDSAMIPASLLRNRIVVSSAGQTLTLAWCIFVPSFYQPIYFQAVKGGNTNTEWLSRFGYYLPFAVIGMTVTAIANGLISTFSPTTSIGQWVGYQILMGAGRGSSLQIKQSFIAIQNALPANQIPVALAFIIFSQNFGGAVAAVVVTTVFNRSLLAQLKVLVPSLSPAAVLAAGPSADAVRALALPDSPLLSGLLIAYSKAVQNLFYMLAGLAVLSFVFSLGMGWKDIRTHKSGDKSVLDTRSEKGKV